MGHAKVDTTLNVYTQVLDASVRSAADRVGAELFTIVHSLAGEAAIARGSLSKSVDELGEAARSQIHVHGPWFEHHGTNRPFGGRTRCRPP